MAALVWKFGGEEEVEPAEFRFELDKERISIVAPPSAVRWGTVGFWAPILGTLREVAARRGQTLDRGDDLGRFDEKVRRRENRC